MVRLLQPCGLRRRRLQERLSLVELHRQLPLQLLQSLRADAALAALEPLPPGGRLLVGLGDEALEVRATALLLLERVTQGVEVGL